MALSELSGELRTLGLGDVTTEVYTCLLGNGPLDVDALAESGGRTQSEVEDALRELTDAGLVSPNQFQATIRYVPVSPETGVEMLASRRHAAVLQAKLATQHAYTVFRQSIYGDRTDGLLEIIEPPAIGDRLSAFEHGALHEIWRLDSPPYAHPHNSNPIEEHQLKQGVRYRSVYSHASLQTPGYLKENILPCVEAGEDARVLPEIPIKLTVIDRSVALVSLVIGHTDNYQSVLVIRPSSLLTGMEGLFELAWRAAVPLDLSGNAAPRMLRPNDRKMLALLATGTPDVVIARELGISRRTLCRRIENLMEIAGASTRFQLALHARSQEWL